MAKRKFIKYPEIHPLLPTPESRLIALNPSTKKAWLRALRSGDYPQGSFYLRRNTAENISNYCCMGVFADLIEPKAWVTCLDSPVYEWHSYFGVFPVNYFTEQQKEIFGQLTKDRKGGNESVMWVLMKANDGHDENGQTVIPRATFEQIALWIERYL